MTNTELLWMSKQALIADNVGNALGKRFGTAGNVVGSIGASMIPGVMAVDSAHNAWNAGSQGIKDLAGGRWGRGALGVGKALGHSALGAISLLPGMGAATSGLAKGVAKATPWLLGKGTQMLGKGVSKGLPTFGKGIQSIGNAGIGMSKMIGGAKGVAGAPATGGLVGKVTDPLGRAADRVGTGMWNKMAPGFTANYQRWMGAGGVKGTAPIRASVGTGAAAVGGSMAVEGGAPQAGQAPNMAARFGGMIPTSMPDPINTQPGGNLQQFGQGLLRPAGNLLSNYLPGQ